VAKQALEICEHAHVAVSCGVDAVDEIRAGKMEALFGDFWGLESEQGFGFCAEVGFDFS